MPYARIPAIFFNKKPRFFVLIAVRKLGFDKEIRDVARKQPEYGAAAAAHRHGVRAGFQDSFIPIFDLGIYPDGRKKQVVFQHVCNVRIAF